MYLCYTYSHPGLQPDVHVYALYGHTCLNGWKFIQTFFSHVPLFIETSWAGSVFLLNYALHYYGFHHLPLLLSSYLFWSETLITCSYPYLAVVLNFSQTWALYCLVQFYSVTKEKLEPIKPLAKFLSFKSIVFLTWWQGVAVAFLFSIGVFKGALAQELKTRIQDYIICIEVCGVLLHWWLLIHIITVLKTSNVISVQ